MEKMEEAGSGEQGKWYKEMHFRQMGWDGNTARAKAQKDLADHDQSQQAGNPGCMEHHREMMSSDQFCLMYP